FVCIDGCSTEPSAALGGATPLAAAKTPNFSRFLADGAATRLLEMPAGPTSLRPLDWAAWLSGRNDLYARAAAFAALDGGVTHSPDDWVLTARIVSIDHEVIQPFSSRHARFAPDADSPESIEKFTARHAVSEAEYEELWAALREALAPHGVDIRAPSGDRAVAVARSDKGRAPFSEDTRVTSVDEIVGRSAMDAYPRGPGADLLLSWMTESVAAFESHPVNLRRRSAGLAVATNVWLEGLCHRPTSREPQTIAFPSGLGASETIQLDSSKLAVLSGSAKLRGWANWAAASSSPLPTLEIPRPGASRAPRWTEARQLVEATLARPGVEGVIVHIDAGLVQRAVDAETAVKAVEWIEALDDALHPLIAGGATTSPGSIHVAWSDAAPGPAQGVRPSSPSRGARWVSLTTK
ncbi:MAG TPA: hypothetical protein VGE52_07170, partial [Pirellulales bacterium]